MNQRKIKIETAGQLRAFLADMIVGIKTGDVDMDAAARITKAAAQINESIYAEIKVARAAAELKQDVSSFGHLPLGD
jgi:hypothetical protein